MDGERLEVVLQQQLPGEAERASLSHFLTSVSGRARSSEMLVLSSLVRMATASSLS